MAAGVPPQTPLDGGTHRVLHTVGEDGEERRDEFACDLNFLATQLWQITIAPKASIFYLKCTKIASGWSSALDPAGGAYSAPPDPLAVS